MTQSPPFRVQRNATFVVAGSPTASKGVVDAVGQHLAHQVGEPVGMDDLRRPDSLCQLEPFGERVDADDLASAGDTRALDDELAHTSRPDD
jgi:hypothetical protein